MRAPRLIRAFFCVALAAPTLATDITAAEIEAVAKTAEGTDREIKIVDLGKYNFGVAVLRRSAMKPGGPASAINHTQLTEVYYIVSGAGTSAPALRAAILDRYRQAG